MIGIFQQLPTLETERLRLRKVTKNDVKDIFEYASIPEISKYTPWDYHENMGKTKELVNLLIKNYQTDCESDWAIELKSEKKVIGLCGFVRWHKPHGRIELAYSLSPEYWGKGIMTEAVKEVIDFGFKKMKLNRIGAKTMPENAGSVKLMEKVGMKQEGHLRDYWVVNGELEDVLLYSILRSDWE
ncbi:GNAT family N-acetyltransferase [Falsibacillus pallidus]|uniref:GNAT family N-acetyltransferase n=1 Tax=Falsibacillus pallidus TaxID=493781 RepID=UPI003D961250